MKKGTAERPFLFSLVQSIATTPATMPAASSTATRFFRSFAEYVVSALYCEKFRVDEHARHFFPSLVVYPLYCCSRDVHLFRALFLRKPHFIDQTNRLIFVHGHNYNFRRYCLPDWTKHGLIWQATYMPVFSWSRHITFLAISLIRCFVGFFDSNSQRSQIPNRAKLLFDRFTSNFSGSSRFRLHVPFPARSHGAGNSVDDFPLVCNSVLLHGGDGSHFHIRNARHSDFHFRSSPPSGRFHRDLASICSFHY